MPESSSAPPDQAFSTGEAVTNGRENETNRQLAYSPSLRIERMTPGNARIASWRKPRIHAFSSLPSMSSAGRRRRFTSNCTVHAAKWRTASKSSFPVQRSHQRRLFAFEPTAVVSLFDCLPVARRLAAAGSQTDSDGEDRVPNHPRVPCHTSYYHRDAASHREKVRLSLRQRSSWPPLLTRRKFGRRILLPAFIALKPIIGKLIHPGSLVA